MHHLQSTPGTHTATHAHAPAPARMATAPTMLDVMLKHQIFGRGIYSGSCTAAMEPGEMQEFPRTLLACATVAAQARSRVRVRVRRTRCPV